jgi:pimeloyl-ACP methyl ester carboxylesterase
MHIEPFRPHVPQAALEDLLARVRSARFPDALPDTGWAYGADVAFLRRLRDHWLRRFEWRVQEAEMRRLRHFRAISADGFIHFVHERGEGANPFPLVLTHGWPGSFLEFSRIVPMLTHPSRHGADANDSFDVVVPSLPGFGFSSRPTAPGMDGVRNAELWRDLMLALGYQRFGAHGGDIGAGVSTVLGWLHADHVAGIHLNYVPASYQPPRGAVPTLEEQAFLDRVQTWRDTHGAYSHVQRTEPQTLAVRSTTRRWVWPPGSRRSSANGATAMAMSRVASRSMSFSRTSASTG